MIALLGYYGFGNLGDELLLQACLEKFRGLDEILVLSNNPEETQKNFKVKSINRWHYCEVIKALRNCEALYLGGGGLFQDSSSVVSCLWYWFMVRLAKFLGLKVFALGQSVGPLDSKISRLLTANALKLCERVEVRDENSYMLAAELGCKNLIRSQDLVLSLKTKPSSKQRRYVLINLRPCKKLDDFVEALLLHVEGINGERIGVALSGEDEKILEALQKKLALSKIIRVTNFSEAENLWATASYAVGMRLHFGVLSHLFNVPAALMPYDLKVSEFAKQFDITVIKFAHEQAQN